MSGIKKDADKPRMELFSSEWLFGVANVLTFGAKKYEDHNWRKGLAQSRLLGAALRHLFSYLQGEDLDTESGLSHLYHASCCIMFASELKLTRPDLDDRVKIHAETLPSTKCNHSTILVPLGGNLDSYESRCMECHMFYRSRDGVKGIYD